MDHCVAKKKTAKDTEEEPLEKQLWKAADKLRKNIDAAEYKHVGGRTGRRTGEAHGGGARGHTAFMRGGTHGEDSRGLTGLTGGLTGTHCFHEASSASWGHTVRVTVPHGVGHGHTTFTGGMRICS